jgi:Sulfotransferase family
MNPYVLICGCPRSGTTLLVRIVGAHPLVVATPETHWIPRWYRKGFGVGPDGRVTRELADALCAKTKVAKMELTAAEIQELAASGLTYSRFVTELLDLYARKQGKQLIANKTPDYVTELPLIHELFPRARIVHIVRDGRDVCLSLLGWERSASAGELGRRFPTLREDPVVTAALIWRRLVSIGRQDGSRLGADLYYELRYEALVERPEEECRKLCAFLDIAYDDAMLRFHEGRTREEPGLSAARAWLPITAGLRDWRTELPGEDVAAFEAAAGDLLDELGYDRAAPAPKEHARQRVARITSRFAGEGTRRDRIRVELA